MQRRQRKGVWKKTLDVKYDGNASVTHRRITRFSETECPIQIYVLLTYTDGDHKNVQSTAVSVSFISFLHIWAI